MIMRPSVKLGKDRKKLTLGPNLGLLSSWSSNRNVIDLVHWFVSLLIKKSECDVTFVFR